MDKYKAFQEIDKIRKLIYSCIDDWPRAASLDNYYLDRLSYHSDYLLKLGFERLDFQEYSNGYYIGETRAGKRNGYGMYVWPKTSLNGYIQLSAYVGNWNNNNRNGDCVYFSMEGTEEKWYVEYTHYVNGEEDGNWYRINYSGLIEGETKNGKSKTYFQSDNNGNVVRAHSPSSSSSNDDSPILGCLGVIVLVVSIIMWISTGFWAALGTFVVGCIIAGIISWLVGET